MRFVLKTAFFIQAALVFVIFNIFTVLKILYEPEARFDVLADLVLGGVIYVVIVGVPWFLVAKSSLEASRARIKDLRGSLKYLKEQKASTEKKEKAAALYNQEIDTLDEVMGQFPTRQLAKVFFGYQKPNYYDLGVDQKEGLAEGR